MGAYDTPTPAIGDVSPHTGNVWTRLPNGGAGWMPSGWAPRPGDWQGPTNKSASSSDFSSHVQRAGESPEQARARLAATPPPHAGGRTIPVSATAAPKAQARSATVNHDVQAEAARVALKAAPVAKAPTPPVIAAPAPPPDNAPWASRVAALAARNPALAQKAGLIGWSDTHITREGAKLTLGGFVPRTEAGR
jgi:hypothetical protein